MDPYQRGLERAQKDLQKDLKEWRTAGWASRAEARLAWIKTTQDELIEMEEALRQPATSKRQRAFQEEQVEYLRGYLAGLY